MKANIYYIFSFVIGITLGIAIYGSYQSHTKHYHLSTVDPLAEPEKVVEYVYIESEPEIITETVTDTEYIYVPYEEPFYRTFTKDDEWYLKDLAMREAEGEGVIGLATVMLVACNWTEAYAFSMKQVWEHSAFQGSMNRTGLTPNEDCERAFAMIQEGWTLKPMYFQRGQYHDFGTPLFQMGNHYYSTY